MGLFPNSALRTVEHFGTFDSRRRRRDWKGMIYDTRTYDS